MKKKLYIQGEWIEGERHKDLLSPHSLEKIAEIPLATREQIDSALESAYSQRKTMANLTSLERSEILSNLVDLLKKNRSKAAEIISNESAKPIKYSLAEVDRTIETYQFAAEEAKRVTGEMIPMDAAKSGQNRLGYTLREPIGVIAAITPFNFPMNLVAHKVGPAIASGNPIVLKPASQTPLSAYFLAELLEEAGMPKGAFNVITGSGSEIGDQIVTDSRVSMVTFTGSSAIGMEIQKKAGLKKVALELGSNAGLIIDQDADLEKVVPKCVSGAFSNQGQVCISLQRIYVHENIADEFIERFKSNTEQLRVGNPLDQETDISALISPNDADRIMNWVNEAVEEGAELIAGGEKSGNAVLPTIIKNVPSDSKVSRMEVFGPVANINLIKDADEGIEMINDSRFGLQAGIFTNNIQTAMKASRKLEVGGVIINDIPTYRVDQMPYGGVKESGNSREGIKYSISEMTETKLVVWNNE